MRGVFFAAIIAATSATAIGSPFSIRPDFKRAIVLGLSLIAPTATASLVTVFFGDMSTIVKRRINSQYEDVCEMAIMLTPAGRMLVAAFLPVGCK